MRGKIVVLICILLSQAIFTYGQKAMLMGRICDADNKPVKGAAVYLRGKNDKDVAMADTSGLYSSQPLKEGYYKVRIVTGNRTLKADDINITAASTKGQYYLFTISPKKKATTTVTTKNPYMTATLSAIEAQDIRSQFLGGTILHVRVDSTGKIKEILGTPSLTSPPRFQQPIKNGR